jgi:hypothetical protein
VTLAVYNNHGFQGAGIPHDWDNAETGHPIVDLSAYAGQVDVKIRYRFESDVAYSSQDQYDNPQHSVQDGAVQLDNIELTNLSTRTQLFYDDCQSGNMGWVHDDREPASQIGIVFERKEYCEQIETGRPFTCDNRPCGSWMYAAVDPVFSKMQDGEDTWLMSPPIDISGAPKLVGEWDMWVDLPRPTNDIFNLALASNDLYECVTDPAGFVDEDPGWWYGGPFWGVWDDDWDAFAGNDWLAILWQLRNDAPADEPHMAGIFLNRQRVGIPSGDPGTTWERDTWNTFHDWFKDDLLEAELDTARIRVKDDDGLSSVYLIASNDGFATQSSYQCNVESEGSDWWRAPPPMNEMVEGAIIRYYYEATDTENNIDVYPSGAPGRWFEMSILPTTATIANPGMLLVDKHGRLIPGDERNYRHSSEYYFREALEILGYAYEKYDVDVPSGSVDSFGPDTTGMKYYDTQIWFTDEFDSYTLWPIDQWNLREWLSQSSGGDERNLLLTGNDIGKELIGTGKETLAFYTTWLASQYVANGVGEVTQDSVPALVDYVDPEVAGGDFIFMKTDPLEGLDGDCALSGGCPSLNYFDVVNKTPGFATAQVVANYHKLDNTQLPAGVAYTHPTDGYQTVNLGFGMEFMVDGDAANARASHANYDGEGHFMTGLLPRMDLMRNILDYFGLEPGEGTGVVDGGFKNVLSNAAPNPFNPVTKIAYSVEKAGPVTIEVYNVAGRVVRTLLDTEFKEPAKGVVAWDGTNGAGERCASGVYFYRIVAPEFAATRKMVMLK